MKDLVLLSDVYPLCVLNFFLSFNLCFVLKSAGVSCPWTLVRWCFARMYLYILMANIWSALVHYSVPPFCKISALIVNCIKIPCINPPFDYYNKLSCNKWNVDFYNKTVENKSVSFQQEIKTSCLGFAVIHNHCVSDTPKPTFIFISNEIQPYQWLSSNRWLMKTKF